ncbi:MAG: MBL fold metallo-hydrolase [Andreesenia angusta]|nr:MBL fold metallo-hydrolase [Andreesenia angusta]
MFEKITKNIDIMNYDDDKARPLLAIVRGKESSLVVDAGNSKSHAEEFIDYLNKENIDNIKYIGITHWHWDHIYGMQYMGLINIGSEKTKEKIKRLNNILNGEIQVEIEEKSTISKIKPLFRDFGKIKNLDLSFDGMLRLDLGGINCIFENLGGDHAEDSTLIFIVEDKTMFLGDMPYRGFEGVYRTHHLNNVKKLRKEILKYDCERFYTAHKDMYSRKEMENLLDLMVKLGEYVGESVKYEEIYMRFKNDYNREPNEEEEFFLKAYIDGNKYDSEK